MATALHPPRVCSEIRTGLYGLVHFDRNVLNHWNLDTVTKRVIALAPVMMLLMVSVPVMTAVHGQQKSDVDYELQHMRDEIKELRGVPVQIALMQQQLGVMVEWHKEDQQLKSTLIDGFLGVIGAIFLAVLGWGLTQFGITIGKKERI